MRNEDLRFLASLRGPEEIDTSTPARMTVSLAFRDLATYIVTGIPPSDERTKALQSLSEAKSHALKPEPKIG